ncbi:MAG: hypothetical protein FJW40_11510 [Acidobacteria bacterium]|nr:hypothetical protein [Acidobacteriota bacterium]
MIDRLSRLALSAAAVFLVFPANGQDRTDPNPPEPQIVTLYPEAGQVGTTWQAEVTGKNLEGVRTVWFPEPGLAGTVVKSEEIKPEKAPAPGAVVERTFKVTLRMEARPTAGTGIRFLRLVSSLGLSNAIQFRLHAGPVTSEPEEKHSTPAEAPLLQLPSVVNGRIAKPGETDWYAFDAAAGQELVFDAIASREAAALGFHQQLTIHRIGASWFDPARPLRLAFSADVRGEVIVQNRDPRDRSGNWIRLKHRFAKTGRYYLEVGSLFGQGGPDKIYQILVADASQAETPGFWQQHPWQERSFVRRLGNEHTRALHARTLAIEEPAPPAPSAVGADAASGGGVRSSAVAQIPLDARAEAAVENEPNDTDAQALTAQLPAILEGTIDRESDVDVFRFQVARGQKLAFELETVDAVPSEFNPRFEVFDSKGLEVVSNLARTKEFKDSKSVYLLAVEAKVVATFEQEGQYTLRIRDVTKRAGSPRFRYRLMIRPQIPHVGNVLVETRTRANEDATLDPWRVNLRPGQARKLNLTVDHEEGFFQPANMMALQVEGLPPGVTALTGSSNPSLASRFSGPPMEKPERYQPARQDLTVVLDASPSAAVTDLPVTIRLVARTFVQGKPGPSFALGELPIMVVASNGGSK